MCTVANQTAARCGPHPLRGSVLSATTQVCRSWAMNAEQVGSPQKASVSRAFQLLVVRPDC